MRLPHSRTRLASSGTPTAEPPGESTSKIIVVIDGSRSASSSISSTASRSQAPQAASRSERLRPITPLMGTIAKGGNFSSAHLAPKIAASISDISDALAPRGSLISAQRSRNALAMVGWIRTGRLARISFERLRIKVWFKMVRRRKGVGNRLRLGQGCHRTPPPG